MGTPQTAQRGLHLRPKKAAGFRLQAPALQPEARRPQPGAFGRAFCVPTLVLLLGPEPVAHAEGETPKVVVFLANADQVSALVVLANYRRESNENAIIPHAAGCQSIGIYAYREAEAWRPRIVVGLNDLSARKNIRRLGKDLMTVAVPFGLFQEMEDDVEGSFLERSTWKSLLED